MYAGISFVKFTICMIVQGEIQEIDRSNYGFQPSEFRLGYDKLDLDFPRSSKDWCYL